MVRYGGPLLTAYATMQLFLPMSRLLLGSLRSMAEVAYFAVPATLGGYVRALPTHLADASLPVASATAGEDRLARLRALYLHGLRWSWLALVPLTGLAMALGGPFIAAWIGHGFGAHVLPVVPTLILGNSLFSLGLSMPVMMAQGMGKPTPWAVIGLGAGIIHVLCGWWLIPRYGAVGAAQALLLAGSLSTLALLTWAGRALGITWRDYCRALDLRAVIATTMVAGSAWLCTRRMTPMLGPVLMAGGLGLGLLLISMRWWLPREDWGWVRERWRSLCAGRGVA